MNVPEREVRHTTTCCAFCSSQCRNLSSSCSFPEVITTTNSMKHSYIRLVVTNELIIFHLMNKHTHVPTGCSFDQQSAVLNAVKIQKYLVLHQLFVVEVSLLVLKIPHPADRFSKLVHDNNERWVINITKRSVFGGVATKYLPRFNAYRSPFFGTATTARSCLLRCSCCVDTHVRAIRIQTAVPPCLEDETFTYGAPSSHKANFRRRLVINTGRDQHELRLRSERYAAHPERLPSCLLWLPSF